jgi:4-carboxymuconolactone decarboxylase
MARVLYFDPAEATGRAKAAYAKLPDRNIFRMLGHAGDTLDGFFRLGNQILGYLDLDPVLRELAILRVGYRCRARYEITQHKAICVGLDMSDDLVAACEIGAAAPALNELQRAVIRFVDDLIDNVRASDFTFKPIIKSLSIREVQELVLAVGYYMLVCRFLETFDVDVEGEGGPTFDNSANGLAINGR